MTAEELNEKYTKASWLIARLSASVAGKALLFNTESSRDAMKEIAAIYELSDDEFASFNISDDMGAVASVQKTVQGLLGDATDASPTMKVAKTAIKTAKLRARWPHCGTPDHKPRRLRLQVATLLVREHLGLGSRRLPTLSAARAGSLTTPVPSTLGCLSLFASGKASK